MYEDNIILSHTPLKYHYWKYDVDGILEFWLLPTGES